MEKKIASGVILTLLLTSMLTLALSIQLVTSESSVPSDIEWSQTYGGEWLDFAYSVVETSDGGYAIVGVTQSFGAGGMDIWLVKTDSAGTMQWNKTYGGADDDLVDGERTIVQTSDGGYVIVGNTMPAPPSYYGVWLIKTDANGNVQWTKKPLKGMGAVSIVKSVDGGFALAGAIIVGDDFEFALAKTDSAGNLQWYKTYGGNGHDIAESVIQTNDGGYALSGETSSFGAGKYDVWLVKTDVNGNMQWNKTFGGTNIDDGTSLVQTDDSGYAIACRQYSFGAGGLDFWLVKTDSYGNMLWSKTYGGAGNDVAWSVIQTGDGGYTMGGNTNSSGAGGDDFWLVKTDSTGNMQWNKTYGGTNNDDARSVVKTSDGGYAIAGYTWSYGAGWEDYWLVKLAPEQLPSLPAVVDIEPSTLNLGSRGKWITAYIQLPEGYNPEDIDASTILLNGTIPPVLDPKYGFVKNPTGFLIDHNNDGILERMVKFDRAMVQSFIYDQGIRYGNVALTITGELLDGTCFEGTDIISVKYAGDANHDGTVNVFDICVVKAYWGTDYPDTDFNKDSTTNTFDILTLKANWNQATP